MDVAAGPSFDNDFHVVGTLLDRAWTDGDPSHVLTGAPTASCPLAAHHHRAIRGVCDAGGGDGMLFHVRMFAVPVDWAVRAIA